MAGLDTDLTLAATLATEINVSSSDARLPRLISAASDACRKYLNRPNLHWAAGIVENVSAGMGRPRILLDRVPVLSLASVVLPDGTSLTLNTDYTLEDALQGTLYKATRWPFTGVTSGGIKAYDPAGYTETPLIVVTYTGGWVTPAQVANGTAGGNARSLPYDLEQACVEVATSWYRRGGGDPNIQTESLGDASVTYIMGGMGTHALSPSVQALLDPYRRWVG